MRCMVCNITMSASSDTSICKRCCPHPYLRVLDSVDRMEIRLTLDGSFTLFCAEMDALDFLLSRSAAPVNTN